MLFISLHVISRNIINNGFSIGRKVRICHTLNNTVIASPRVLIPIMELYQNADGSITVPEALRP